MAVVIFVFRVLKDANFQPRIALITRTVELCIVDLAHFLILFALVSLGFATSGVMLFGHQYEGFSTLSHSAFYLIFSLIAFNPDEGWVQVGSSATINNCGIFSRNVNLILLLSWTDEPCNSNMGICYFYLYLDYYWLFYFGNPSPHHPPTHSFVPLKSISIL